MAILFPILIIVVLVIVQVALWASANAVAQAAAEHGAEVASLFGSSPDDGKLAAEAFVSQAGQVEGAVAEVAATDDEVTVTVRGTYPSVFGRLDVSATTTQQRERVGGLR